MNFRISFICLLFFSRVAMAADDVAKLEKAVERGTLNQRGTAPFHLRAALSPTYLRKGEPDRSGEVEYWWTAPDHYRRELRSAGFHQIEVRDGTNLWQQNEGDYLPFWLAAIAHKLIEPVSPRQLEAAKHAEARHLLGQTYFQWTEMSSGDGVQKGMGDAIRLRDSDGLLLLESQGKPKYQSFAGRQIATVIADGSPEVTATVTTLEKLSPAAQAQLDIPKTATSSVMSISWLDEPSVRKSLQPGAAPVWPQLKDGPLEGALTVRLHVDRDGHPRECEKPISDNPGLDDYARDYVCGLHFRPIVIDGMPAEVNSRWTMGFHTTRPAGTEAFDTARSYFEKGRVASFPAAGSTPYTLRAELQAVGPHGDVQTGSYEDVFQDEQHWRREVTLGNDHLVRSRNGEQYYRMQQGSRPAATQMVLRAMEPIPAIDTFTESDWRIRSATLNSERMIEVLTGAENSDGTLDPEHARAYWFDSSGQLRQAYFAGFEVRRFKLERFANATIARTTEVFRGTTPVLLIKTQVLKTGTTGSPGSFEVKGFEWKRQFTAEVR